MEIHKVIKGIVAGIGFLFASEGALAGFLTCATGESDFACALSAPQSGGRNAVQYHVTGTPSNSEEESTLTNGTPNYQHLGWGELLNYVWVLQGVRSDVALMTYDTPDESRNDDRQGSVITINEPGTIALLGLGLLAIGVVRFRHHSTPDNRYTTGP